MGVASEDSFIPRTIYAKAELLSQSRNIDVVETMLYMQGSETLLKQLYDLVWQMGSRRSQSHVSQNEREVEEIISKLGIKNKHEERPEAHVYLKFIGQKLYSVDAELIERVVRKLSTWVMEDLSELERGMEFEYMKVLDPYGGEWALPTETGMPVNIFIKHPIVAHNKAEVKTLSTSSSHPVVELELKGVFNIKRQIQVGIMTPLTGKYHGTGLETSVSVATPLKVVLSGRKGQVQATLKQLEHQNEETLLEIKNVRLGKIGQTLFPICTKETLPTKVLQKLSSFNYPSSCTVEAGKVQTFDKFEYNYHLNDCEQVVFSERSTRPRVLVTTKKDQVKQHIKMVVDGHKMEIEVNKESRYSRDSAAVFKVNGQVQQWSSLERKMYEEEIFVTRYMDGVYSLYSPKYGVEVIADGERLEVKSPQFIFRNRVTGICGDLNGEWTADIKSSRQCVTPKPKTSAYSFLIENGKCQGIPQQEKSELQRQEQRCVREQELSTQVTHIFRQLKESSPQPEQMHIIKEHRGEICFSKNLIRICSRSHPKEVGSKQVGFVCISGPQAEIFKRRVLAGDLVEEFEYFPTKFVKTVYEPRQC